MSQCVYHRLGAAIICALFFVGFAGTSPVDAARSASSSSSGCLPGVLKRRLSQIRSTFGRVRVISSFRRGARIAGSGRRSYHASCRAVDFVPPRGKYRAVVAWLKRNHFGGIGTYSCGLHHIHIDNGPRVRFHHCVNRKGRPTRYAKRRRSRKARKYSRRSRRYTKAAVRRKAGVRRRRRTSKRVAQRKPTVRVRRFSTASYRARQTQNGS